jgi:type I restriction enzyme M protein
MSQSYDRTDLDRLSRPELLGLASKLELKLPPALAKDELIEILVRAGKVPAESLSGARRASAPWPRLSLRQLESHLWDAANILRGKIDSSDFKHFIFGLLFFKRLCDVWQEEFEERYRRYGDPERAADPVEHRFHLPPHASWQAVRRHKQQIGRHLNQAFQAIESANPRLAGVFQDVSFDNPERFPDATLELLLSHFEKHRLRNADVEPDMLGNAYEYLISEFADDAGKKGGEFYTPRQVARLIVECLEPRAGMSIYDPACGSGGMLLEAVRYIERHGGEPRATALYGQEMNLNTWAICQMNLFLHGIDEAQVVRGDTLRHPKHVRRGRLATFDRVLANPPFSLKNWGWEEWRSGDAFGRDRYGCPPRAYGDLAFVQHMLASLAPAGLLGVVVPRGILYRGGSEASIRRGLVEDDLIEAIISLPSNLFYGTGVSACVLIINRRKPEARRGKLLVVRGDDELTRKKGQQRLSDRNVERLAGAFHAFRDESRFARVVELDEIRANGHNLTISRYLSTFVEPEPTDMPAEVKTLKTLRQARDVAESRMMDLLAELGYDG